MAPNFATDLREMLSNWNTIQSAARAQHPNASAKEISTITAAAMNRSLGLK